MSKLFEQAVAEAAKLPDSEQDRIGAELIAHLEKLGDLRKNIERAVRSLDAGVGRSVDIEDVIARARSRRYAPE